MVGEGGATGSVTLECILSIASIPSYINCYLTLIYLMPNTNEVNFSKDDSRIRRGSRKPLIVRIVITKNDRSKTENNSYLLLISSFNLGNKNNCNNVM